MLRAEAAARAGYGAACVLRLGGIYGPGRDSLVRRILRGEATCPAGIHYTNRIHRDDAVGAILHMLQEYRAIDLQIVPSSQSRINQFII